MAPRSPSQKPSESVFPYQTLGEDGSIVGADYRSLTAQVGGFGGGEMPSGSINPSPAGGAPGGGAPRQPVVTSFFNAQRMWDILTNNPLPFYCLAQPFPRQAAVRMGAGTASATLKGLAALSTTDAGNVGAGETDLTSFVVPANSFSETLGKVLHVTAWGICANNANAKTLRVKYAGVAYMTYAGFAVNFAHTWKLDVYIARQSAGFFESISSLVSTPVGSAAEVYVERISASGIGYTADQTFKLTGQGTANDDIVQSAMVTEFYN